MGARRQTRATQCLGQGSLRRRPVWRRRGVAEHGGLASLGIVKHNLAPARWRRRSVGGRPSPSRERSAPRPGRFCSAVCAAGAPSRSVRPRFRLPAFGHWPHHAEPVPSPRQHVEEARFCTDSPLEGGGFEPSVPRWRKGDFRFREGEAGHGDDKRRSRDG